MRKLFCYIPEPNVLSINTNYSSSFIGTNMNKKVGSLLGSLLCLSAAFLYSSVSQAQTLSGFKTNLDRVAVNAPVTALIDFQTAGNGVCGLAIDWGDGKGPQNIRVGRDPDAQSPVSRQRSYDKPGTYTIKAEGVFVSRGLNSAPACQGSLSPVSVTVFDSQNASPQVATQPNATVAKTSATAAPVGLKPEEFVLFFSRGPQYATVKKLDGTLMFAEPNRIQSPQAYCAVYLTASYSKEQNELLQATLPGLLRTTFQKLGVTSRLNFEVKDCIQSGSGRIFINSSIPIMVVQRAALGQLSAASGFDRYTEGATIPGAALASASLAIQEEQIKSRAALATRATEFEDLASRRSKEKIGSITLSIPKSGGNLKICTRRGDNEFNLASGGYFATQNLRVSKNFLDAAIAQNARIDRKSPFTSVFKDLEEFYIAIQRTPDICQIYVDYPENLKTFINALKGASYELNPLVPVTEAKSDWAKQQGYLDFSAYEFAKEIGGNASSIARLSELGVSTREAFSAASQRMTKQGYSKEVNASVVIEFLRDEASGAPNKLSALAIRSQREKEAEAAAKKRAQEAAAEREAYAKRYPFYAVLSCGFGGSNMNIIACFSGSGRSSVDTELKLTQGSVQRVYKVYELASNAVGQARNDGLHIDLQDSFSLTAQNASDSLTLTLRVYDRRTNKLIVQKEAGSRFAVVSARN